MDMKIGRFRLGRRFSSTMMSCRKHASRLSDRRRRVLIARFPSLFQAWRRQNAIVRWVKLARLIFAHSTTKPLFFSWKSAFLENQELIKVFSSLQGWILWTSFHARLVLRLWIMRTILPSSEIGVRLAAFCLARINLILMNISRVAWKPQHLVCSCNSSNLIFFAFDLKYLPMSSYLSIFAASLERWLASRFSDFESQIEVFETWRD